MTDQVDIFNRALSLLEEGQRVQSVDDDYVQVRSLNEIYAAARDEVLELHNWNFAVTRAELPALVDVPLFGWDYQYAWPHNCLRVLPITHDGQFEGQRVPHQIEANVDAGNNSAVRVVLTNASPPLRIRYIRRVEDPAQFSALFTEALVARIAMMVAHRMTGKQSYLERVARLYETAMAQARRQDSLQGTMERAYPRTAGWLDARRPGIKPGMSH
jgi:hypothetical protein